MKYSENKINGISKKELEALEKIAMAASYTLKIRGGIETRNNDEEDFPEIGINSLQTMLEEAFRLGKAAATK